MIPQREAVKLAKSARSTRMINREKEDELDDKELSLLGQVITNYYERAATAEKNRHEEQMALFECIKSAKLDDKALSLLSQVITNYYERAATAEKNRHEEQMALFEFIKSANAARHRRQEKAQNLEEKIIDMEMAAMGMEPGVCRSAPPSGTVGDNP